MNGDDSRNASCIGVQIGWQSKKFCSIDGSMAHHVSPRKEKRQQAKRDMVGNFL